MLLCSTVNPLFFVLAEKRFDCMPILTFENHMVKHNNNNYHCMALCPGLPGEPVPEVTLTHPPSWSSSNLCQLLPSTSIHSILLVQITCLAIFFCTTSFHVLFGLPLGLEPSTSYSTHFFTQSVSSFRSTCPYHRSLFFFAVVSIIYHLFLVFLLTSYLELCLLP